SRVPVALYRASAKSVPVGLTVLVVDPAATILPLESMATANAWSAPPLKSVTTLPALPKPVSRVPSVLYRASVKSLPSPPATTILPCDWMQVPRTASFEPGKARLTLPPVPNVESRSPEAALTSLCSAGDANKNTRATDRITRGLVALAASLSEVLWIVVLIESVLQLLSFRRRLARFFASG